MQKRHTLRTLLAIGLASLTLANAHAQAADVNDKKPVPASPRVKLETSLGDIVIELSPAKAPKTVENFLQYVDDKHYDGLIFHRVIDNFMIQGGGFTPDMAQKATRAPIQLEAANGLKNDRGTVAMARTMVPNSATSQFFINVKDNDFLNAKSSNDGYAVFGLVVEGMDVVDKIRAVKTGRKGPHADVPTQDIVIIRATRTQ